MLRFAPSPIGDMHIDELRIAILNYVVAQQRNDQFLIRIEDTDTKRNIEGKDTEIMMVLEKFALKHNAVFHQSEHLNLYQTLALRLLKERKAFVCKCLDEESEANRCHCEKLTPENYTLLKESGEPFVIRVKKPTEKITYSDIIKGDITTLPEKVGSSIILRRDGTPTYNFACAADDMMSNIDCIIRDAEHLSNTPKQIHIKNLLGYADEIEYVHIPTLLNSGETPSVKWLFSQGFIPDAILNYLLLLGNREVPKDIFTLPEAMKWFKLENISKSATKFDINRLRLINREHLKLMHSRELSRLFGFADADIGELAKLYLEECSTINELEEKIRKVFKAKDFTNAYGEEMSLIADIIADAPAFETFDKFIHYIRDKRGVEEKHLFTPLKYLLTGAGDGPELAKIYPFIKSYILEVAS